MKTEFLALWVDDNRPFAESLEMELRSWLDEKGFELKTLTHKDKTKVLDDVKNNDLELIIVDYKLPKGNGDGIIEEIRAIGCYQDVIFYSEGGLPDKRFDGVFYVSKEDAKTRIKELIDLKIKRSSDLATMRGWIVADAIELELMLEEVLVQCFNPKHHLFESEILRRPGVLDFFKKQAILNSILSEELRRLLEAKEISDRQKQLQSCKEIFKSFEKEVIHYRNAVAHSKVEITPEGIKRVKTLVKEPAFFDFDEGSLIQGRKNLRKHRDNLNILKTLF